MKKRDFALDAGRFFFLIFCLYTSWFREAYGVKQVVLYGSTIALTAFVALDILRGRRIKLSEIPSVIKMFLIFAIYAFVTGIVVAEDVGRCVSSLLTYIAYSVVCFDVYYISKNEGSFDWVFTIIRLCGCIVAIYIFTRGYSYHTSGVYAITLGPNNNPNYLGLVMLVAVMAVVYDYERFIKRIWIYLPMVIAFTAVIVLSASRKCLICLGVLLIVWLILLIRAISKGQGTKTIASLRRSGPVIILILVIGVAIGGIYFFNTFSSTNVYAKFLKSVNEGEGLNSRMLLYEEAWDMFLSHPIVGVGFDQYRVYSSIGKYSHSAYAEILSCHGLIGMAIFYIPIFSMYIKNLKFCIRDRFRDYTAAVILLIFTVELILGIGQIFIYEFFHLLVLTYISYAWSEYVRNAAAARRGRENPGRMSAAYGRTGR